MKGMGCFVWDTPEIVRAKKSYELQSEVSNNTFRNVIYNVVYGTVVTLPMFHLSLQLKYRDGAKKEFNNYSIVTDTPAYVTAVLGHTWASDVSELHLYKHIHPSLKCLTECIN